MAATLLPPPPSLPSSSMLPIAAITFPSSNTTLRFGDRRRRSRQSSTTIAAITTHRSRPLDRHATTHNRLRFVRKLTTLLLSKPRHFLPLKILSRCRHYLRPTRPLLQMILRYPSIFRLFHLPSYSSPVLCVGLTPAAADMAAQESALKAKVSDALSAKLQKLLMMSEYRSLLLNKLVHLGPDLGLPVNFRSRLCNRCPERFRTVESSYGRALVLSAWDSDLAMPTKRCAVELRPEKRSIIDRPPKFKQLRLRKGLNLKRRHRDYLLRFQELPEVSPYTPYREALEAGLAEKRACSVVREILLMTVEKRTLVDHLTHFRKEMGLPNKLRGLLVRHPEMFYISLKGMRDSVFLVEGYDDNGKLLEKDELLDTKERLMELVSEGKRMRRERKKDTGYGDEEEETEKDDGGGWIDDDDGDQEGDLQDLFEAGIEDDWEEFISINGSNLGIEEGRQEEIEALQFWSMSDGDKSGCLEESRVW